MTKKSFFIPLGACITILALIGVGLYFYLDTPVPTKEDSTLTTPIPTPTIEKGEYLILPNNYPLSDREKQALINSKVTYILIEGGDDDVYLKSLAETLNNPITISSTESRDFAFCNIGLLAISPSSAQPNANNLLAAFLSPCSVDTKDIRVLKSACSSISTQCLSDGLIRLSASEQNVYYYFPQFPLLGLASINQMSIDNPLGATILTWGDSFGTLVQRSYSVEILNTAGVRLYASGRINSGNMGDYYIPTTAIPSQKLTVKLRLWLNYGNVKANSPVIITANFDYVAPQPALAAPSTKSAKQMSWIPDWGMASGIASIRKNPSKWDTISPVWFTPNKNGSLNREPTVNSATLVQLLKEHRIRLVPTISLFDADILHDILNSNMERHIADIVTLVTKNNYAGIDLDYESTYEADRELLIQFVTRLADKLHEKNKILSFTALPKIDDRRIYAFLPQTHQAQDWRAIGAVVDEFRIMAYDFTGQGSLQPGPLSPYQWNEMLIKYAISKMPAEKVVLALPLYSHGWPKPKSANIAGPNNDHSLSSGKLKNTISLQHADIDYIKGHSIYYRETYDTWNKEVRAEFKYNGVERIMYYLDKKAISDRLKLARQYGIKGVCYWRIGDEKL